MYSQKVIKKSIFYRFLCEKLEKTISVLPVENGRLNFAVYQYLEHNHV